MTRWPLMVIAASLTMTGVSSQADPVRQGPWHDSFHTERLKPWAGYISVASQRFGIPTTWIEAVIMAESAGLTTLNGRPITSSAGAMGLMQLMPDTYEDMRISHALGADPHDPQDNILAGTAYLRAMYDRFGYPGLFAAYNAGPQRYERSFRGEPLPKETQIYLTKLTRNPAQIASGPEIFVRLNRDNPDVKPQQNAGLFVPLRADGTQEK
ncbi:lytic transglycosylase domain-containing protein [Asticcacaulis sp. SL142]|uniref:lytic transglycosylase domain-containing protein n=1 Tax=Asticcacaulis sp. SL142 TaxID=2995155 RepID=UPI00226CC352|nr:lytic transglycosylase domain-containing protein [Asticcacaulis sp. SL142]WAC49767.1 lytic transglycosylase domain-containing protein [Asticcacaulis sp. SL142]